MKRLDTEVFFDSLVKRLHDDGVLRDYDQPHGRPRKDWPEWTKQTHAREASNTPGCVYHVGDVPYDIVTTLPTVSQKTRFHDFDLDNEAIQDQTASIRKAITHYVPNDAFAQYLRYFSEHTDLPSHREALAVVYKNIRIQLHDAERSFNPDESRYLLSRHTDAFARTALVDSAILANAAKEPELLLTLALYQAAHIGYLAQLRTAVDRSHLLSEEEKDNARSVISGGLHQFREFIVFSTLMPLILLKKQELEKQEGGAPAEDRMPRAIDAAWKSFFDRKILKTNLDQEIDVENSSADLVSHYLAEGTGNRYANPKEYVFCPANHYLKNTAGSKLLESLYASVHHHREAFKPLLKQVKNVMTEAIFVKEKADGYLDDATHVARTTTRGGDHTTAPTRWS